MAKRCRGTALAFSRRKRQLNPRGWNSSSPHTGKPKALGNKKKRKEIHFLLRPVRDTAALVCKPLAAGLGDGTGVVKQTRKVEPNYFLMVNENHCGNSAADGLFCFLAPHEEGMGVLQWGRVRSSSGSGRVSVAALRSPQHTRTSKSPSSADGDPAPRSEGSRGSSFFVHTTEPAPPPRLAFC